MEYACKPPGKCLRSRLLCSVAHAYGVSKQDKTLQLVAEAMELGHSASLVHDDIIDRDPIRRGKPSVYDAFGADTGLLVGDALIFQMFQKLGESAPTNLAGEVTRIIGEMGVALCRGQALEAQSGHQRDKVRHYFDVIRYKTAEYFVAMAKVGAMLAGVSQEEISPLVAMGYRFGLAFQIHDDFLPVIASDKIIGKPVDSDVRNSRITALTLLNDGVNILGEYERYLKVLLPSSGCGDMALKKQLSDPLTIIHTIERFIIESFISETGLDARQLESILSIISEGLHYERLG